MHILNHITAVLQDERFGVALPPTIFFRAVVNLVESTVDRWTSTTWGGSSSRFTGPKLCVLQFLNVHMTPTGVMNTE